MRSRRYTAAAPALVRSPASWRCHWPGCAATGEGDLAATDGLRAFQRHYGAEHLDKPWPTDTREERP